MGHNDKSMDLLTKSVLLSAMLCLAEFSAAQVNCPAVDARSPAPTALVSSRQIRVQLQPPLSNAILGVPNRIEVVVKGSMLPIKVELWAGPTGTDVAASYCRLSSDEQGVRTGRYKKFTFKIADCMRVSAGRLEPRVYVAHRANPYSVYVGPFECRAKK